MAQKVNIVLVDDIDGSEAEETVSFALDGKEYEIDLSARNATKLRDAFAPYVGHARKAAGRRRGRAGAGPSPADIRAWARDNGFTVPDRGRVSSEVREAYLAAH
ncbi:MAG TPA: Lsr2 family protein [Marmoricola sp.]|nr:Lsr2 family protein [Marmoricola sp.]